MSNSNTKIHDSDSDSEIDVPAMRSSFSSDEPNQYSSDVSEASDSSDEEYYENKSVTRDEILPLDIMEKIATFMTTVDKSNTFATNKTMSFMKYIVPIDLSDTPLTMKKLVKYAKSLSKYKITGLSLIVVAYPTFKDNKHPTFKYVSDVLNKITNLKLKLVATSDSVSIQYIDSILQRTPNLISLKYNGGFTNANVKVITSLSKLNTLSIKGAGTVGILETLDNIPNLVTLKVKQIQKVNLLGLTSLKYLKLYEVVYVLGLDLCSSLETLVCNNQRIRSKLNLHNMPNLTELSLTKTNLDHKLKGTKNHKNLQKLTLNKVDNLSSLELESCSQLRELEIATHQEMKLGSLLQCPRLNRLSLAGNITITSFAESLKHISIYDNSAELDVNLFIICSNLESLYNEVMQDYDDLMFLSNCTKLKTLWLTSENCLSLKGLNLLTKLENLDITSLGLIEDISPIADCINLRRLAIQVMGKDLRYLANCTHLISLHIDQAYNGLSGLENCTQLVELSLNQCNVKDLSKLKRCTQLKFLSLNDMEKLTSLSGLQYCTNLISVEIYNCKKLKDISALQKCASLLTFRTEGCPKMEISTLTRCLSLVTINIKGIQQNNLAFLQSLPRLATINQGQILT